MIGIHITIFREPTNQQLQACVSVTTTLDPSLSQQTITTLAPFSALPTSTHQHSLVSLPFSSWLFHVFCCYRRKEKHSQERRKAWLQRVQVRHSTLCCCIDLASNACRTFRSLFNSLLSLLVGLVEELLSSTSTRYAEFTAASYPHPSPPHSTQSTPSSQNSI